MKNKIGITIAVVAGLMLGAQAAQADAMLCSGEQKNCITNCQKKPIRQIASDCIANCRARLSACMQTGCWDNGTNRYCNLTRK
jgi:hypothetical protein